MTRIRFPFLPLGIVLAAAGGAMALAADPAADVPVASSEASDPDDVSGAAFVEALQQLNPLTPEQIRAAREHDTRIEQAARLRAAPERAESDAIVVSLEPGSTSPVIELLHGYVTALEVMDATGQPWPISRAIEGDDRAIKVERALDPDAEGGAADGPANVLTVNPDSRFSATNLVISLVGASRPLSVVLRANEATPASVLRDRITLVVDAPGPNAIQRVRSGSHLDAGQDLRNILLGRAPVEDAAELIELPDGMRAWRRGDTLWLRSQRTLISPAPVAQVALGDVQAYRLRYRPIVVVSTEGVLTNVDLADATPMRRGGGS